MAMFLGSLKLFALCVVVALASGLKTAAGAEPLLTITPSDSSPPIILTREQLEAMPATTFLTSTTWTEGVQKFTGVALKDLLEALTLEGRTMKATALNDYSVDIPVTDAVTGGPILAYLVNAAPLSVRDKGPLWIVYPYDARPDYRSEVIYSRSIWQLDRIRMID